jgi:hypothetical protein
MLPIYSDKIMAMTTPRHRYHVPLDLRRILMEISQSMCRLQEDCRKVFQLVRHMPVKPRSSRLLNACETFSQVWRQLPRPLMPYNRATRAFLSQSTQMSGKPTKHNRRHCLTPASQSPGSLVSSEPNRLGTSARADVFDRNRRLICETANGNLSVQ